MMASDFSRRRPSLSASKLNRYIPCINFNYWSDIHEEDNRVRHVIASIRDCPAFAS